MWPGRGRLIVPTAPSGDSSNRIADTAFVAAAVANFGTVSQVNSGTGLAGGPISTTGTLSIDASYMRGYLGGLTLSGGGSQTLTINAGVCTSDDFTTLMKLASNYTKTFAAWAVGSGNGGLDTGSIATNTWYHVFIIERTDTSVVDVLISLSATAPTLPANYTKQRRIGSIRTDATPNIISFFQNGDTFLWSTIPSVDVSTTMNSTAALATVTTPTGVRMEGIFAATSNTSSAAGAQRAWLISSPDVADTAPTFDGIATIQLQGINNTSVSATGSQARVWTNTSAQIRHRSNVTDAATNVVLQTLGWVDTRGRFA